MRIDRKNIVRREALFKEVSERLSGLYYVCDRYGYPQILKLKKIYFGSRYSDFSDTCILASFENIYWDESDAVQGCKLKMCMGDEFQVRKYSEDQMKREFVWRESDIEKAICVGMEMNSYRSLDPDLGMNSYRSLDPDGLEHKLCDLLFENIYEWDWAAGNYSLLNEQIESLSRIREQCKSNELLQPYYKKVIKAVRLLAEQRVKIYSYLHDAQGSATKIFEYLSVPAAIKGIDQLNLDPLRVSFKGGELRDSFQKAQELHKEFEQL